MQNVLKLHDAKITQKTVSKPFLFVETNFGQLGTFRGDIGVINSRTVKHYERFTRKRNIGKLRSHTQELVRVCFMNMENPTTSAVGCLELLLKRLSEPKRAGAAKSAEMNYFINRD